MGALISVVSTYDPVAIAGAIFNGPGVTVLDVVWVNIAEASSPPAGTFTDGPYGIGSGGILTNGIARRADIFEAGTPNSENEFPGSTQYCGSNTFDATVLQVLIDIQDNYNGVEVEFILSSMEYTYGRADPIGIYLDDVLWSLDDSNQRITAASKYLNEEIGINEKDKNEDFTSEEEINRATRYDGSSPPLVIGIPASPGHHTMVFAICDSGDYSWDSALLVKAKGCTDCDPKVRINYVSTTTTTGSTSFTSTTKAVGTESGTVLFGVPTEEPTTTTEEGSTTATDIPTTTATEDVATTTTDISTTDELPTATDTTTTTESQESSTQTSGTDATNSTTLTSDQSSTATTAVASTTTASTETSTETDTPDTNTSSDTTIIVSTTTQTSEESSTLETTSTTGSLVETDSTTSDTSTSLAESSTVTSSNTAAPETVPTTETTPTSSEASTGVSTITTTTGGSDTQTTSSVEPVQTDAPDTTSGQSSITPQVPDSTTSASSPADTVTPRNLEAIGRFTFLGCLGSPDGYPSFDLVATSDDMTPSKCVSLAADRLYIGVYDSSCYASDSLESTTLVGEGECDIPCSSAPLLFCGGLAGTSNDALQRRYRRRRDAPSNVLLTLYGAKDAGDTSSSGSVTETSAATPTSEVIEEPPVITEDASASLIESITSEAGPGVITQPTASSFGFPITSGQAVPFPPNRPVPTSGWLGKNNMTQIIEPVVTVSTITYTIVDPNNPSTFKVEEYCSTIQYYPCHRCENQDIPAVHMTTIQRQCNACGANGENSVYLTVPAAVAKPTAAGSYDYPGHPLQHGSEPFQESPVETGLHHANPAIPARPTKAQYNPLPPAPEKDDSVDKPGSPHGNQPQAHPQDALPKEPQVEAPKVTANERKPIDQVHPTSQFIGGYDLKTTTLPTWYAPSEVPVIVSAATMSFPLLGFILFVFASASVLNSV